MAAFVLAAFYLPYPARLNPNLERARAHSLTWARELGMLDAPKPGGLVWDEAALRAMDYALLCAYTHPDWPTWTGSSCSWRTPANPAEVALAELWARTVPAMPAAWRRRFVTATRNLMIESMWELENIDTERVANPIEYLQLRRRVGGAPWSACLAEYATGAEVPARFAATRPLEVLRDSFAAAVHLRHDLFSYQREVTEERERECVLVFEKFLGYRPQRAADLVGDLLTARMQQFEQQGLDAAARAALRHRARLLRDYMAGVLAWHRATPRYTDTGLRATYLGFPPVPAGLGTAAARVAAAT